MRLSLEAKVGLLILTAAILLGGFLFVLGGVSFKDDYTIRVDFRNPGSVQPGAAVRVGGVKVGTVEDVTYLGRDAVREPRYAGGRRHARLPALVRMRLSMHKDIQDTIDHDALFYVTSQGVLGEQFIAVDPSTEGGPPLPNNALVRGEDPPRLDLALNLGYELLEAVVEGVRNNREELGTLIDDLVALIHGLSLLVSENRGDLDGIIDNVRLLSEEGVTTLRSARENYIDGERPRRIMQNLDRTVALVDREAPNLVRDVGGAARGANEVLGAFGPEQREQIQRTIARADSTMGEAQDIVHHVREGQGTVGALLMDEEIYDDLQELIRDLKHNPWKFFWRE